MLESFGNFLKFLSSYSTPADGPFQPVIFDAVSTPFLFVFCYVVFHISECMNSQQCHLPECGCNFALRFRFVE